MDKLNYQNERKSLMDEAEKLLAEDKIDESTAKMDAVNALDDKWSKYCEAQANMAALDDNQEMINIQNYSDPDAEKASAGGYVGESVNFMTGNSIAGRAHYNDPLYLHGDHAMTNYALNHGANTDPLLMDGALGDTVRGMVTGHWKNPQLRNAITTSGTGSLIPQVLSGRIIDLARDLSLFASADVPTISMDSNNVKISRIKKDPVFSFKKEAEPGTEVDVDIDSVDLKSHTCYGYAYVSLEAIESSQNLDSILNSVFAQAIAECIDQGMLYGVTDESGDLVDYAPSGIMNDDGIITLDAINAGYDDFVMAQAAIRQKNYDPSVWAVNAYTDQTLSLLKDNENRYLGMPEALTGMKKIVSNQLAYDEENGSDGLVFDPNAAIIGIQNDVRIKMIEDTECLKNGLQAFQIYCMLDCQVVSPDAICRIKGLK